MKVKRKIKITAISDLHGEYPETEGGDLLIVAGDLTAMDREHEYGYFRDWLETQNYEHKVFIAGNHDGLIEQTSLLMNDEWKDYKYLQDSGVELYGLKIWGSPWTPTFYNWHFMLPRGAALREKWNMIPSDTDILVTHGPPLGIGDYTKGRREKKIGCEELLAAIERVKPKVHIFGHIHSGQGMFILKHQDGSGDKTLCLNVAYMDEDYEPVNSPITFQLEARCEIGDI